MCANIRGSLSGLANDHKAMVRRVNCSSPLRTRYLMLISPSIKQNRRVNALKDRFTYWAHLDAKEVCTHQQNYWISPTAPRADRQGVLHK